MDFVDCGQQQRIGLGDDTIQDRAACRNMMRNYRRDVPTPPVEQRGTMERYKERGKEEEDFTRRSTRQMFRIQKLLQLEYKDFGETVLIESPFAQVTEHGIGIEQVQLGLTVSRLLIGIDIFEECPNVTASSKYTSHQDPEIESFRLKSLLPIDFLEIKAFRKGTRQILRITKSSGNVMWFEFGGHILKNMYWNIWRERISSLKSAQTGMPRPYIGKHDSTSWGTTTSSEDSVPPKQVVRAQIHGQNMGSTSKHKLIELKPKRCYGSVREISTMERPTIGNCNNSGIDHEMIVRESCEFFRDTRSEIIMGQYSIGRESDEVMCNRFLVRSASTANMEN